MKVSVNVNLNYSRTERFAEDMAELLDMDEDASDATTMNTDD